MGIDFGIYIKKLRKQKGMVQCYVEKTAHLSKGYLSRIESGEYEPRIDVKVDLLKAVGLNKDEIIGLFPEAKTIYGEEVGTTNASINDMFEKFIYEYGYDKSLMSDLGMWIILNLNSEDRTKLLHRMRDNVACNLSVSINQES